MSKKSIIEKIIKSRTWIWIFELKRMIFDNLNFRAKILFYESKENIKKDICIYDFETLFLKMIEKSRKWKIIEVP